MTDLNLLMPMAGRGSRFERLDFALPKPLISLHGRPFFAWAIDSLAAKVALRGIACVVLREHVERFAIDRAIVERYPAARVVVIDDVTAGAAETAAIGLAALADDAPFAVNDCDHAFDASGVDGVVGRLASGEADAALLGFPAASPGFSYVRFDAAGGVIGTVEKIVASPYAIAGCYLFADQPTFRRSLDRYRHSCDYAELFMSGVYNTLISAGGRVDFQALRRHVPFGTPDEMARVSAADLASLLAEPAEKSSG